MRTVRLQDAAAQGLTRGELRSRAWQRTSHGLYVAAEANVPTAHEQHTALLHVLPSGSAFAEINAARVHGWDLPPLPDHLPICVAVPPATQPRRRGLRARRLRLRTDEIVTVDGVPATAAARTLTDLASSLSLVDLVVMGDGALRRRSCDLDAFRDAPMPRRGARRWRRALTLFDSHSESPWETLLRLVHVMTGLGQVQPQVAMYDDEGNFVGRGDLWLVGTRRLHEFDGAVHRDRDQHGRDLARDRRCARAGYERYGYTARDVIARPAQIVRDAETAFGLDPDPTRVRPWLAEIRQSLFTASGQQRLRRLWRLGPGAGD